MNSISLDIRGTLTECTPDPSPTCEKVVYQKTGAGFGNLPGSGSFDRQRRRHVIPQDPKTAAQLARRSMFSSAVAAWQALDPSAKLAWRDIGKNAGLPGYQTFLSHFLKP